MGLGRRRSTEPLEPLSESAPVYKSLMSLKIAGSMVNSVDHEQMLQCARSNFSSFPQYFQYISNFRSQIIYSFAKCGCSIYFFLNSANLICRGMYISRYFRGCLGLRDNGSRLYTVTSKPELCKYFFPPSFHLKAVISGTYSVP